MASKPVKLQRPDSGHRVQSLLEIRTWPRALMETTAAIVTAQPRNENPVTHVQAGEMALSPGSRSRAYSIAAGGCPGGSAERCFNACNSSCSFCHALAFCFVRFGASGSE